MRYYMVHTTVYCTYYGIYSCDGKGAPTLLHASLHWKNAFHIGILTVPTHRQGTTKILFTYNVYLST